jgi:hypothetical protein
MTPKLHFLTYNRRKSVDRFVLQVQPWNKDSQVHAGFDVTEIMQEALQEDKKRGFDFMTGPAFGHEVYRALECGNAHVGISNAWITSVKTQDESFMGFVESYMQNAYSAPAFFESIDKFRERQNLPRKSMIQMSDVDVLDFRPMIRYRGNWKNFRSENVNIKKTYDYGTFFKDQRDRK